MIPGRYAKGVKGYSSVELVELLVRRLMDPRIQFRNWFTQEYQLGLSVPERLDPACKYTPTLRNNTVSALR